MTQDENVDSQVKKKPRDLIKGWAALFLWIFFIWTFVFYLGPWIRDSIPIMKQLTEVARERDIDTTAFFYSENKEFYEAERYLNDTLGLTEPKGYGFNRYSILGIVCCIVILIIGYRFLPNNSNPDTE